ncbi:Gfo/Idh/MocA family oxidoreductase [Lederbergia sp. NSJ-179]|uniref:Gfo/Idh/MocA family protein n=1 Tax=Lederbergia sp. NSJ-179 TaxID=2931402 RepID=UPI001FD52FC1|nr:Gfo/Idh/MocA family oxidoreductase [Lederbergia sp. NSJ-179]MCJ7843210.1 Gfo/Idh/MocA family oxidoreductase [Lederbergia sp. NSJ-179]
MKPINIVGIGYGGMGSYHLDHILPNEAERFHVVGTYDIRLERQEKSREMGHKAYDSLESVLGDKEVEAVIIATPNDSHKDIAIQSLRAGKHVVCEKPVTLNLKELDEILAVVKETNKVFMVHQNRRWDPDFLITRELYQNEHIGELFQIESRVQGANGIPGDWRHEKRFGGGMLLDWGVHLLDQLLFMIDSPIKKVAADFSYILGNDVDDGFISYLTFQNGIKAIVEVGTTNFVKLPRWYIKGTKGTAMIKDWDLSGELVVRSGEENISAPKPVKAGVGLTKTMAPPSEEATALLELPRGKAEYDPFYKNFYSVVREGAEPVVKNEEVRRVMALIEKIFEAVEKQQILDFE